MHFSCVATFAHRRCAKVATHREGGMQGTRPKSYLHTFKKDAYTYNKVYTWILI